MNMLFSHNGFLILAARLANMELCQNCNIWPPRRLGLKAVNASLSVLELRMGLAAAAV
jgi:hypothetical protein